MFRLNDYSQIENKIILSIDNSGYQQTSAKLIAINVRLDYFTSFFLIKED